MLHEQGNIDCLKALIKPHFDLELFKIIPRSTIGQNKIKKSVPRLSNLSGLKLI